MEHVLRDLNLEGKAILITGVAGFVGSNLVKRLFGELRQATIVGIDNMNDYYDVGIKRWRLRELEALCPRGISYTFTEGDIADRQTVRHLFELYRPAVVVNLAAQAGVRYSIKNPDAYILSNVLGFFELLEACRHSYDNGNEGVEHLVYASSSSVYGQNSKVPYSADDMTDTPVSLYAATKKGDELLAHAYAKLYDIPTTGLRFFTVYGPAGRPDMAYFSFTDKWARGETVELYNYGKCERDFTYVDDIVEGVLRVMRAAPARRKGDDGLPIAPHHVYNIGNSSPVPLLDFVHVLYEELQRADVLPPDFDLSAHLRLAPMQPGDVPRTCADVSPLERDYGFKPSTTLRTGLRAFAEWYRDFYIQER